MGRRDIASSIILAALSALLTAVSRDVQAVEPLAAAAFSALALEAAAVALVILLGGKSHVRKASPRP